MINPTNLGFISVKHGMTSVTKFIVYQKMIVCYFPPKFRYLMHAKRFGMTHLSDTTILVRSGGLVISNFSSPPAD